MTLHRFRARWLDSRDDEWKDITMLAQWESECAMYVTGQCEYKFRRREVEGIWGDSLQIFLLSKVVLPYVLIYE